jgi:hypothetical protein
VTCRGVEDVERRQHGKSAGDLLVGAREIGAYVGKTPGATERVRLKAAEAGS